MEQNSCADCEKKFSSRKVLQQHAMNVHSKHPRFHCDKCTKTFRRKGDLNRHTKSIHNDNITIKCDNCEKTFKRRDNLMKHLKLCSAPTPDPVANRAPEISTETAQLSTQVLKSNNKTENPTPSSSTSPAQSKNNSSPKINFTRLSQAMRGQLKSLRLNLPQEQQDDLLKCLK